MGTFEKITNRIFPPTPPPQFVETHLQFRRNDSSNFKLEADTLEKYHTHSRKEEDVRHMARVVDSYQHVISLDGDTSDLDPRAGHVVSAATNEEYHSIPARSETN